MSLVDNERLKLTATWINTLASAAIVAGVIAPTAAVTYSAEPSAITARNLVIGVAIWFAVGLCLHSIARSLLKRLRP